MQGKAPIIQDDEEKPYNPSPLTLIKTRDDGALQKLFIQKYAAKDPHNCKYFADLFLDNSLDIKECDLDSLIWIGDKFKSSLVGETPADIKGLFYTVFKQHNYKAFTDVLAYNQFDKAIWMLCYADNRLLKKHWDGIIPDRH